MQSRIVAHGAVARSGSVEPFGGPNPWGLSGDGSLATADGSPFLLEAFVDENAVDADGSLNPDYAEFVADATLIIDGREAILSNPTVDVNDDQFAGSFDSVGFRALAELVSTPLFFSADVRLPTTTFELLAPAAPDLPPSFAGTNPIQFGGSVVGNLVTEPANAPVSGIVVPWAAFPSASLVEWSESGTVGSAEGVAVTLSGVGSPSPYVTDLSAAAFDAAPHYAISPALDYDTGSTWTATFSEPVATILLYVRFWRGTQGGANPMEYHFDVPFRIRSGLEAATIVGNSGGAILSLPETGFHSGILQIEGPVSNITVTPNSTTNSGQGMAMALVPMLGARPFDWMTPTSRSARIGSRRSRRKSRACCSTRSPGEAPAPGSRR